MFNFLFPFFAVNGQYVDPTMDPEYNNLTEEEKENMDFVQSCINGDNQRVSNAAFYIQLLLIELSIDPDKYEPETVHERMEKIQEELSDEEKSIIDRFTLASIKTMGIYSEEAKEQRRQEKQIKRKLERNDKNE